MENTTTRTVAQIAVDMDRIAKHRKDVNRLKGDKLRAYKFLELELNLAKAQSSPEASVSYLQIADMLRKELGVA